jgi:mannose-6-phosphate isomerase-like protein (cupin superfamily)
MAQTANEPAGYHYWSRAQLEQTANALAPQMDEHKFKTEILASAGKTRFQITHREAGGESELHDSLSDVVLVQSGHATLTYGGTMVGAKTTGPGEVRGTGIDGGITQLLSPGDVVVIPSRLPHLITPSNGDKFNYFVVKVADQ